MAQLLDLANELACLWWQGIDGKEWGRGLYGLLHGGKGKEVGKVPFKYEVHKHTTPLHRQRRSGVVCRSGSGFYLGSAWCQRMCLEPFFKRSINACLPAITGGAKRLHDLG